MTGYGRGVGVYDFGTVTVELRSFNHRFLEIISRMPRELSGCEDEIKKYIQEQIQRGRVECTITVEHNKGGKASLEVDWELADSYFKAAKEMSARFSLSETINLQTILSLPNLIISKQEERLDCYNQEILETVSTAIRALSDMRTNEGRTIREDFIKRVSYIVQEIDRIRQLAPQVVIQYRTRLLSRIKEFLADTAEIDEARLMNEIALFIDRSNIDEELLRLHSHCQQYLNFLDHEESVGRKLDFLLQEMKREINTIGSKANDLSISQIVINIKSEIEKLREQVQNIE